MPSLRPEYPRPQFERVDWINLNGEWTFHFERTPPHQKVPDAFRHHEQAKGFQQSITVPFAPESALSGVGEKDFLNNLWYHRKLDIPAVYAGKKILLNFGAVFYRATVFINGEWAGYHVGGSTSFSIDITRQVKCGASHDLVVAVENDLQSGIEPSGKQSTRYHSYGCFYTRNTGIWQTVWLEAVHPNALARVQIIPDFDGAAFIFIPEFHRISAHERLLIKISDGGKEVARADRPAANGIPISIPLPEAKHWSPENPYLYAISLETRIDGTLIDSVKSYAGLRKVHIEGNRFFLNNKPLYQRLVLDQGFYPDGIWTAPNDAALKKDIELSLAAGFNGARLHQKVFEERFYYWADMLGYLCWGETPSWGLDVCNDGLAARNFLSEWREILERDRNHPSIIVWTGLNESRHVRDRNIHHRITTDAYKIAKAIDPTRPVNDASGYVHHLTDVWTVHVYLQEPVQLNELLNPDREGGVFRNHPEYEPPYEGQPYIIDEFGGIKWNAALMDKHHTEVSWGYGEAPKSTEEFYARLEGLVDVILGKDHINGYCYTQLTDVEQEQNGIYHYNRTEKFDMQRIRAIFLRNRRDFNNPTQ